MPVRKVHSVKEMNQPVWRQPGDPAPYRAILGVWETGRRLQRHRFTPGVFRYRSIEELEAAADVDRS